MLGFFISTFASSGTMEAPDAFWLPSPPDHVTATRKGVTLFFINLAGYCEYNRNEEIRRSTRAETYQYAIDDIESALAYNPAN